MSNLCNVLLAHTRLADFSREAIASHGFPVQHSEHRIREKTEDVTSCFDLT